MAAYKKALLSSLLDAGWKRALAAEFQKPYFNALCSTLAKLPEDQVYPPREHIFEALNFCPLDKVKVVLVGQDPYHDDHQAHGLCFSVQPGISVPPSLRNMYQELESDIPGFARPDHGYLLNWAKQGILMLNATLTVTPHKANSHKDFGWQTFTSAILDYLNQEREGVVFALWGGFAKKKGKMINRSRHAVVENAHPSPLSIKSWRGCRPFSKINAALLDAGKEPIDWSLPAVVALERPSPTADSANDGSGHATAAAEPESRLKTGSVKSGGVETASSEIACTNVVVEGAGSIYKREDLQKNTVARLKELLRMRALPISGRKEELIDRLLSCNVSLKRARVDDSVASPPQKKKRESEAISVAIMNAPAANAIAVPAVSKEPLTTATVPASTVASATTTSDSPATPLLPSGQTDFSRPELGRGELKIVTWNVASWSAVQKKGLAEYVEAERPDILCINETKVEASKVPANVLPGYFQVFCSNTANPGYAGVAILSKREPLSVIKGLAGQEGFDDEQRALTFEFEEFFIVTTYVPNSGMKLKRIDYRMEWDGHMQAFLTSLQKRKPVVWCGDLNVARSPLDLARPKTNKRTAGFTDEERSSFEEKFVQELGMVDSFRALYPNEQKFTFWPFRLNCRAKNIGWRLDYFMVSAALADRVRHSWVRSNVLGSDHCPHGIILAAS